MSVFVFVFVRCPAGTVIPGIPSMEHCISQIAGIQGNHTSCDFMCCTLKRVSCLGALGLGALVFYDLGAIGLGALRPWGLVD